MPQPSIDTSVFGSKHRLHGSAHGIMGGIKPTLMLILASAIMLVVELRSHLIQQLRQPVVWGRHHPAVRVVHRDEVPQALCSLGSGRDIVLRNRPVFVKVERFLELDLLAMTATV